MKEKIFIFLKGILMGICDLIPGISGGTIAFITGIYERLINAVKGFSFDTFKKRDFKRLDLGFLVVLLMGIFTAILIGSRMIKFLLDNYFSYTLSFFIGLILASSFIIFENIKEHRLGNVLFCLIGFVFGGLLIFLVPLIVEPGLVYVFFGGFVAISAMFLPGISGAFILLIMGLYDFILEVLHNPFLNWEYLLVFGIGAILGAMFISRLIGLLFKKDRCKTLYFLLGLVIGALGIPIKKVYVSGISLGNIPVLSALFLLGVFLVFIIRSFEKKLIGFQIS